VLNNLIHSFQLSVDSFYILVINSITLLEDLSGVLYTFQRG